MVFPLDSFRQAANPKKDQETTHGEAFPTIRPPASAPERAPSSADAAPGSEAPGAPSRRRPARRWPRAWRRASSTRRSWSASASGARSSASGAHQTNRAERIERERSGAAGRCGFLVVTWSGWPHERKATKSGMVEIWGSDTNAHSLPKAPASWMLVVVGPLFLEKETHESGAWLSSDTISHLARRFLVVKPGNDFLRPGVGVLGFQGSPKKGHHQSWAQGSIAAKSLANETRGFGPLKRKP